MIKKIVIIGPESTGKSTLCEQLAQHYGTVWCPEYAREYLLKNGTNYTFEDLAEIAKGQLNLEETFIERVRKTGRRKDGKKDSGSVNTSSKLPDFQTSGLSDYPTSQLPVFLDTDMYVMKVWCEFVFGRCHQFILDEIVTRKYDLYLLCNTDLPWTKDELREYPDFETRETLFKMYKDLLINQSTPWVEIKGNNEQRLQMAIAATEQFLNEH
ncbi:AAA family ATPase [Niabella ginsengisoli]|uniref:ATP-binding protein n=1 Tax=Niabella ginsengisoli TaxID=522298 RepID=A0ABS9SP28_9BACT|nr:ATP-binding protein [Niabella ginsengisoli]MCH5600026.1 ATP-binding protein [Niabella ginsengisoli]